jgi:hypothetical protein
MKNVIKIEMAYRVFAMFTPAGFVISQILTGVS